MAVSGFVGICLIAVMFLVRFFVALCREQKRAERSVVHFLDTSQPPRDEPDPGVYRRWASTARCRRVGSAATAFRTKGPRQIRTGRGAEENGRNRYGAS